MAVWEEKMTKLKMRQECEQSARETGGKGGSRLIDNEDGRVCE